MQIYEATLIVALFASGLAAGVFFTFTALVIPGLRDANARESLKGFQTIDRRLQPNSPSRDWQPLFGVVIFGSVLLDIAALALGFSHFSTTVRVLMIAAALVANLSFWIPTFTVILPFNNRVRDCELDEMDEAGLRQVGAEFEIAWGRWNLIRTLGSAAAFALLIASLAAK